MIKVSWHDAKFQVLLVFLVSCFTSALCDVQPSHLPRELRACLTQHTDDDPDATDEEVTISCMLEFMWLNRKECEVASPETVTWLSSLVNRSIEQTVTEFKDDVRTFQGLDELKLTKNTGSRTDSAELSPALLLERLMNGGSPRRRKEYRMLSDEERSRYHAAINAMKNDQGVRPNKYDALVSYHQSAARSAHGGPAFLGWHRYYLVMYEMALQEQDPDVMLAYWDSTLENGMNDPTDSVLWTHEFAGNGDGNVVSGPFANWVHNNNPLSRSVGRIGNLIDRRRINRLIRTRRSHGFFARVLEMQHNGVHVYVGGNMMRVALAPSDPIFYMHHAFIDCVWERYRIRQERNGNDPTIYPRVQSHLRPEHNANTPMLLPSLDGRNLTNLDGYANFWTRDYYRCAPFPWCSNRKPDCGSKWLRCDLFQKRCVPKDSSAVQPEITPERMLEIAETLAPEPEPSTSQTRGITLSKFDDEEEENIDDFVKPVTSEAFFAMLNESNSDRRIAAASSHKTRQIHRIQSGLTIDQFVIPTEEKVCGGGVTQNTFSIDCEKKSDIWTYIPVEITQLRHGNIVYESYPVDSSGNFNDTIDVFSTGNEIPFLRNSPTNKTCKLDKSGLSKVKIVAYGLDYNGIYEDQVFLDNRQSVSKAVAYMAVKRPSYYHSSPKIFITAINECGSVCQPMILRKQRKWGNPVYQKFNGVFELTPNAPTFHSDTYRGAEALVWENDNIPYENKNQIPVAFYCNCLHEKPWNRR